MMALYWEMSGYLTSIAAHGSRYGIYMSHGYMSLDVVGLVGILFAVKT